MSVLLSELIMSMALQVIVVLVFHADFTFDYPTRETLFIRIVACVLLCHGFVSYVFMLRGLFI